MTASGVYCSYFEVGAKMACRLWRPHPSSRYQKSPKTPVDCLSPPLDPKNRDDANQYQAINPHPPRSYVIPIEGPRLCPGLYAH